MYQVRLQGDGRHCEPSTEPVGVWVASTDQPIPTPPDCSAVPVPSGLDVSGAQIVLMEDHGRARSTDDPHDSEENHVMFESNMEGERTCDATAGIPPTVENSPRDCGSLERSWGSQEAITTLMVQNIPGRIRQESVLQIWPPSPWANYNLFYMPYDKVRGRTAGHAFINFVTHEAAMEFRATWQGQMFPSHSRSSSRGSSNAQSVPIDIRAAVRQGLDANIAWWRGRLDYDTDFRFLPAVIVAGQRYQFWYFICCMEYVQCENASQVSISQETLAILMGELRGGLGPPRVGLRDDNVAHRLLAATQ